MEEFIETTAEKVLNSLDGFSWSDQSFMLLEIAERLKRYASECLYNEYGLPESDELNMDSVIYKLD